MTTKVNATDLKLWADRRNAQDQLSRSLSENSFFCKMHIILGQPHA